MSIANIKTSIVVKVVIGILLIVAGVSIRPIIYLATVYACIVILLERETESIICIMFAWLNVSTIFKFSIDGTSVFTLLELVVIAKLFLRKKKIDRNFLVIWIVYVFYLVPGVGSAYTDLVKAICMPPVIYLIASSINCESLRSVSIFYIIGVFANSIIGLLRTSIPNMTEYATFKLQGYGYDATGAIIKIERFCGLWGDPNYYSVHLIFVIAIVSVLFSRKDINGLIFYGVYIAMTLFGAMTGSKSFLLMLIIVTFLTIILLLKEKRYSHSFFFVFVISIGVILLLSGYIDVFSKILFRMENLSDSGLSTGRTEIWEEYYVLYNGNLQLTMFGSGLGRGFLLRVPHNTFLDVIILFGIVGAVIVFATLFVSVKQQKKLGKTKNCVPLLTLGGLYFFLSMFYSVDMPFQIALAASFLYVSPTDDKLDII